MTDSTPLLHPSLDTTIEYCIGDFSWNQFFQVTLISLAWFFDAQQSFISVFTDAEPKWTCKNIHPSSCNQTSNLCHLPPDSWSWTLPESTSIISEWSLQCSGSLITGLPASSFYLGGLIGGFALATLADTTLGRKNMLAMCILITSLSGILTAFSTNIWMYVCLRFVSGFWRATNGATSLVLASELVGKKWRGRVGVLGFVYFTFGFLSLPLIAYLVRGSSWRLIYLWACVPAGLYSGLVYFLVHESPRWLFVMGRKDEFVETLRSMAPSANRSTLTMSFFHSCTTWEDTKTQETGIYSCMKILLNTKWAFRRLSAIMVVGFGIGMIYYGMPLGLGSLSLNLYLSVTLNAISEFPASILAFVLIGMVDRKTSTLGLMMLSGICSILCVLVKWNVMQIVLELITFSSACTAFDVVVLYTLELFPTCVRNSAVAMVRQALVFGGVLGPMLVAAGRKNGLISYGVFGVLILVCGMFVVFLPETRGRVMCDTIEEEESSIVI